MDVVGEKEPKRALNASHPIPPRQHELQYVVEVLHLEKKREKDKCIAAHNPALSNAQLPYFQIKFRGSCHKSLPRTA